MSLDVSTVPSPSAEWDAFVRTADEGTPFHLTAWKRVVEKTFGARSHYLVARRGGGIEGVLPLFEVRGLFGGRALISVPWAVYGGICATTPEARRALADAAADLGRRRGVAYVELRQKRDQGLGLPTKSLYVTFARPISKDEDENARAIPRKQRRMTRQGVKYGLQTVIGRAHLDRVYDLYARSVHALGSPVFPRRLFRLMHEAFEEECQVVSVWHGDRPVAGVVTLFFGDQVLPYFGADARDRAFPGLADVMYWELMCYAAKAGYRVFDFGRSREGTGSYEFKRHWGFEPVALPYQYILLGTSRLPDISPANPRVRVATRAWTRLPLAVANTLGPVMMRYLP